MSLNLPKVLYGVTTEEKVIVGGGVITKVGEVIGGTAREGAGSALGPAANAERI